MLAAFRAAEIGLVDFDRPADQVRECVPSLVNTKDEMLGGGPCDTGDLIADTQAEYPYLKHCSFDKAYHSRGAAKALGRLPELVATPRKGNVKGGE